MIMLCLGKFIEQSFAGRDDLLVSMISRLFRDPKTAICLCPVMASQMAELRRKRQQR